MEIVELALDRTESTEGNRRNGIDETESESAEKVRGPDAASASGPLVILRVLRRERNQ
jgi:hypothetical protein